MNSRNVRAPLAALPLAILATLSHAQTSIASLDETMVTATRVQQPLTDVVADVTILDRTQIERTGATGLADVLARVPGVAFARNGGPASTTSVYVRGAESRFTAVFVDGVRIDSQSTGGATWNAIPLAQVERIEVVRGPAAAVYGSDALGGVIQIFTRKGETGFSPAIELGAGSHGSRKVDISLAGGQGAWDYSLGVSQQSSDGFNAQPAANPDRDGYRNSAVSARLGWQVNAGHRVEFTLLDSDVNAQYDGFRSTNDDRGLHDLRATGLNWSARWSDRYKTQVSVTRSRDRYETTPSPYLTDTRIDSYLWLNEWQVGGHQFTAALERREDELKNASTTPTMTARHQDGIALGYGWRQGAHSLQVNARLDDDSEFGQQTNGSAAYAFAFLPNWRALASAGTAFRAPTLFQRFSMYGTPDLRPETSRNIEAGVKYEAGSDSFSAVLYRNKVRDLIAYGTSVTSCAYRLGCYGNTDLAQYSGLTLAGSTKAGSVMLGGSLDFQNPKDVSVGKPNSGKQLARRARQMLTLTADAPMGAWQLGGEVQLVGERFNNASNTQRLPGYGVLNLSASTALTPEWSFVGRVDNLGDKDYQTALGYATGGRTVYLGVKWAPR
ncbi:MAG: TonB-dependent receptor [Hydrogenophaga sp.]|jgi:vitamin B12 transporter|nr:TonB-dependent receptor [Hydrogenophaga sp.]